MKLFHRQRAPYFNIPTTSKNKKYNIKSKLKTIKKINTILLPHTPYMMSDTYHASSLSPVMTGGKNNWGTCPRQISRTAWVSDCNYELFDLETLKVITKKGKILNHYLLLVKKRKIKIESKNIQDCSRWKVLLEAHTFSNSSRIVWYLSLFFLYSFYFKN